MMQTICIIKPIYSDHRALGILFEWPQALNTKKVGDKKKY